MKEPRASTGNVSVPRWFERGVTYKVAALLMLAAGAALAWLVDVWVFPTFIPFLAAWILCFFLGLLLSKIVRDRVWLSQKRAAVIFLVAVVLSYLPLVAYGGKVAATLIFPAMAAVQGIGTAIGFHMPWLYAGKASHTDIEGIDDLMASFAKRER
jgi:hypothetical protein